MGMTIAEKILAFKSGRDSVKPGDYVECGADLTVTNDTSGHHLVRLFDSVGAEFFDARMFAIALDHLVPPNVPESAHCHNVIREFVHRHKLPHMFESNEGNHLDLPMERGLVRPGMLIPGNDSHCTQFGALGALGVGIGITETVELLVTGKLWFKVPETIRVEVRGEFAPGVGPKDLILELVRRLGSDGATYRTLEFCGSAVNDMSIEDRTVICNMAVEMGAKAGVVAADGVTREFMLGRDDPNGAGDRWELAVSDADARYETVIEVDLDMLGPMIALPPRVDNVVAIEDAIGIPITQAFIGSCTNGRLSDLTAAARILSGHQVKRGVRLIVTPTTKSVLLHAIKEGIVETLLESGALLAGVGCGACTGICNGVLADEDLCVATINRNFPGRMGSTKAKVFLASPMTAAASSIAGCICDPRTML